MRSAEPSPLARRPAAVHVAFLAWLAVALLVAVEGASVAVLSLFAHETIAAGDDAVPATVVITGIGAATVVIAGGIAWAAFALRNGRGWARSALSVVAALLCFGSVVLFDAGRGAILGVVAVTALVAMNLPSAHAFFQSARPRSRRPGSAD